MLLSGKHLLIHAPDLGIVYARNSNAAIQEYYGKSKEGAIVRYVYKLSPFNPGKIHEKEIITSFNDLPVSNTGSCVVQGVSQTMNHILSRSFWGDTVRLGVWNPMKKKKRIVKVSFGKMKPILQVRNRFPALEKVEYVTCMGLVVMELTTNHIRMLNTLPWGLIQKTALDKYSLPRERQRSVLLITEVLSDSPAYEIGTLKSGDTIKSINDKDVHTVNDFIGSVAHAFKSKKKILVETHFQDYFAFSLNKMAVKADAEVLKNHRIPQTESVFCKINKYGVAVHH